MTEQHYHINVFWSADDQCWIADVPDLRPCSAHGNTPSEAVAEAEVAIALWLETARDNNMPIPEPRYQPSKAVAA
jgi:predicted RNase H-like HicB family nuclease